MGNRIQQYIGVIIIIGMIVFGAYSIVFVFHQVFGNVFPTGSREPLSKGRQERPEEARKLLADVIEKYKNLKQLEASGVVEIVSSSGFVKKTKFSFYFERPDYFALDWKHFSEREVTLDSKKIIDFSHTDMEEHGRLQMNGKVISITYLKPKDIRHMPHKAEDLESGLNEAGRNGSISYEIPLMLFNEKIKMILDPSMEEISLDRTETIDNVECNVVTGIASKMTETEGILVSAWIGKEDLLIHKINVLFKTEYGDNSVTEKYDVQKTD